MQTDEPARYNKRMYLTHLLESLLSDPYRASETERLKRGHRIPRRNALAFVEGLLELAKEELAQELKNMSEGPIPSLRKLTETEKRAAEELCAEIKRTLTLYDYDATNGGQFDLWRDVFPEAHESRLQYGTIYRLEGLAAEAGGWWHFPDANSDELGEGRFYDTDNWIKMNSQQIARM